jgi:hypothetical protein
LKNNGGDIAQYKTLFGHPKHQKSRFSTNREAAFIEIVG